MVTLHKHVSDQHWPSGQLSAPAGWSELHCSWSEWRTPRCSRWWSESPRGQGRPSSADCRQSTETTRMSVQKQTAGIIIQRIISEEITEWRSILLVGKVGSAQRLARDWGWQNLFIIPTTKTTTHHHHHEEMYNFTVRSTDIRDWETTFLAVSKTRTVDYIS